ncbi:M48 family metallopeptidase [Desulfopila sp. IMCC35006]|uniref:M48 family metallopeptidase n=1 Tax=Desulfopila sp. IMCC35006 TaxID=2569542 RepID=UPI001F0D3DDF|nr:M48 family metallopeptidase [Desulfopila sp. IMCC35006]
MYTNLLLFLVAIFLFSIDRVPSAPLLPGWQALLLFLALLVGYARLAGRLFGRSRASRSAGYFQTEKQLSILALVFFGMSLYLCDAKYYLSLLSFGDTTPALVNLAGLLLFVIFLAIMWRAGKSKYELIFGRKQSTPAFILSNIKANLPIVLPWAMLSLLYDIVAFLPFPGLQKVIASEWGDLLLFGFFLFFVLIFFPPLVRRLWGCRKLPEGALKKHLDAFCARQNFSADYYLWPLFEGQMLTAAVMGIVPGLRYILLTPALIQTMSIGEIEAIMAHEIGHVKKFHLVLYVFLITGFSLLVGMLAEPFIYMFLSLHSLNTLITWSGISAETALTLVGSVPLLIFMLVYFRFIFGYFIRNFERQADLFSFATMGNGQPLVSAFEKISALSGNIRDQPNWHHFGIGERIDCLEHAERDPELVRRHDRKIRYSLIAYVAILLLTLGLVHQIPTEMLAQRYQENFAESVLQQKIKQEPDRALWQRLIGDLMLTRKMEEKALAAYEKAYSLDPANPEIMNNFAWLLLTSENLKLRDPAKALTLARAAATLQPKGHVLDTLATAYWANGLIDAAVSTEKEAAALDPSQRRFYLARIIRFTSQTYEESMAALEAAQKSAQAELK